MRKKHLILLFSAMLLWGCDTLPLDSWYKDIVGDEEVAEVADPEVANEGSLGVTDAIDFRKIHWNDFDIGDWPVEEEPFGVSVGGGYISWTFDQSHWPERGDVNANIFLIWEENGRYYGESFEHIRPRAKLISSKEAKGGGKIRSKPDDWRPTKGERYGMVLASHVRGWNMIQRRTNIEIIRW